MVQETPNTGAGPYQFATDVALAPGESYYLDFRDMEKGRYKKYLPFDTAQVTNSDTSNAINANFNGLFDALVVPNAIETFDRQGVNRVTVTNEGGSSINAGDITIEVKKEPYGADDRALEKKNRPPIVKALSGLAGGLL